MEPVKPQPVVLCHVVTIPWPGRGHINPMMNFCKRIVRRDTDLRITFVVTEEWLGFIGTNPKPDRIHFAILPNLIPSELMRANVFMEFIDAIHTKLEEPFERLLDRLQSPPPTVIISDAIVLWAVHVGTRRNIPVASFRTSSASIFSLSIHSDLLAAHGHFPIEPSEPKAIDFFTSKIDFPVYATSPLIPLEDLSSGKPNYIRWLDEQTERSVLYISQGSFLSVSEDQMEETVRGVRESGVRFVWVARGGESKLKQALEGSSGVVVSWCDLLRVLCHPAVGGFWTHCGYNSTMEGIYSGVRMLTFPLSWDQFLNAKMIVDDWRVGMRIESKKKKNTELLITGDEIKEMVKRFMDGESEQGKEMRRRASDLSEICRGEVAKISLSNLNIGAFIKDITKIV